MRKIVYIVIVLSAAAVICAWVLWMQPYEADHYFCRTDADCGIKMNTCGCATYCANIYHADGPTCMRECMVDEVNRSVSACECANGRCAPA